MLKDFVAFLKEYKIVSLAIAFIVGAAATSLVGSLVKDIVMPFIEPLMAGEAWEEATISLGPVNLAIGSFAAELLNFVIIALIVFIVVKKLIKQEEAEEKKQG